MTAPFGPVALLRVLHAAGVEGIVIGGVAATLHGAARATYDLDILYSNTPDNRTRLAAVLREWHARPRDDFPAELPFSIDATWLHRCESLTLTTDAGSVDVFQTIPGVGSYDDAARDAVLVTLGDLTVKCLSLDALIRAKEAVDRPKDYEALIELRALRAVQAATRADAPP